MFKIFGKKQKKLEESTSNSSESETQDSDSENSKKKPASDKSEVSSSNPELLKISIDIDKLKGAVEGFAQIRSSITERMSGLSEQIGELRAMILDRDRTIQEIELKAVKAADLVETVQPEKLMIEIQRGDAKFEALKANLEGNESIMERLMEELRDLRKKFEFFRGVEEIVKLSDEVKKDLVSIKKTEALIQVNTDKIETIYSEFRKKYKDADLIKDDMADFKVNLQQHSKEIDVLNSKIINFADKDEVDKLMSKMEKYIESLKEVGRKSSLSQDLSTLKKLVSDLK